MNQKKRLIPIDEGRLRELRSREMSCLEIAEELGFDWDNGEEVVRRRMVKLGIPRLAKKARQHKNASWKGGRVLDKSGYVLLRMPQHPMANSNGYVREHRLVMSQKIGRLLLSREVVHHQDGDKQNNSPSNLVFYGCNGDHLARELKGKVPKWTTDGRRRILDAVRKSNRNRASSPKTSKTDA